MARNTTQNQTTYIPKFAYPFSQKNKEIYKKNLDALSEGNYLFTKMGFGHGGIHFQGNALTGLKIEEGIKCIADGELVAYRLDENYHGEGRGKYSTSFFLVRHKIEYPANNKLTFFSLYMHTAKKDEYNIIQNNTNQTNQSNTNYYTIKKGDTLGKIARENHTTVDKLRQDNNIADVNKIKEGNVLVIKTNNQNSSSQNTQSTQSNPSNPNFLVENPKFDEVVILSTPKPINAGETLGLMGEYNVKENTNDKCLYLEVFANKDFKTFVQNAKRGDKNLPQSFSWATIIDEQSSTDHISIFENLEVIFKNNPSEDLKMNGMFKELFNLIDKNHENGMEPQELVDATINPIIKDITNKYIVKHSSEWDDKVNMVDVLLKIVNKIDSSEFENKEEYKKMLGIEAKRIINLSFFTQCKDKIEGFPSSDKVYVMNAIGLVNEFLGGCVLTAEKLHKADPSTTMANCEKYIEGFNLAFEKFEINTCLKKAHFLAQVLHESGHLRLTKEGGGEDYLQSQRYYPYVGRGLMQITWENNYKNYGLAVGENFLNATNMQKLETAPHASQSAGWFWKNGVKLRNGTSIDLNLKANRNDFLIITAKINGGFNGFDDRLKILKALFQEFGLTENTEYKFNESEVYEDAKLSFAWGLWHDPLLTKYESNFGITKDVEKAKEGYKRTIELLTPSSSEKNQYLIKNHPNLTSYKDMEGNIPSYGFAKRRLDEL